ncbi:hypothetical protein ACLB2K_071664 [Fragaria x ananassa]
MGPTTSPTRWMLELNEMATVHSMLAKIENHIEVKSSVTELLFGFVTRKLSSKCIEAQALGVAITMDSAASE